MAMNRRDITQRLAYLLLIVSHANVAAQDVRSHFITPPVMIKMDERLLLL